MQSHLTHLFFLNSFLISFYSILDYLPLLVSYPICSFKIHVCPVSEIFVTLVISILRNIALFFLKFRPEFFLENWLF